MNDTLAEAIERNALEKWHALGAEIIETPDCLYQFYGKAFFNKVVLKQQSIETEEALAEIVRPFKERDIDFCIFVPKHLETTFLQNWLFNNHFHTSISLTRMMVQLESCSFQENQQRIEVREISLAEDLGLYVKLFQESFSLSEKAISEYLVSITELFTRESRPFSLYIGYLQGTPVACGCLSWGTMHAGIYHVGTIPSARRCGMASQIVSTLLQAAIKKGYSEAVLNAMPHAKSLYEKLGFVSLSTFTLYEK